MNGRQMCSYFQYNKLFNASKCAAGLLALLLVSACGSMEGGRAQMQQMDDYALALMPVEQLRANAREWESRYRQDDENPSYAIHYSQYLRHLGEPEAGLGVMRLATIAHNENREVLKEYGKTLLATGSFKMALDTFERARSPVDPDWDLLNQMGVAYDHLNQYQLAQQSYQDALKLRPGEPRILANQGMSYALSGNLPQAFENLQRAASHRNATGKIRENYSLIASLYQQSLGNQNPQINPSQNNIQARSTPNMRYPNIANPAISSYFQKNEYGVMEVFEFLEPLSSQQ